MSIFTDESEMQNWLEEKFLEIEGLNDLIINIKDIENFNPTTSSSHKIKNSYTKSLDALYINEVISHNKNISLTKGEALKPDTIAYAVEKESIVIIELKNFANATRQAGTELIAYAGEIKSSLSYLSDGEIVNVIISPSWPTLLKHYIFNNIVWQNKYILCLEPVETSEGVALRIIDIDKLDIEESPGKFCEDHLAGYHICLYDDTQQTKNPTPTQLHNYFDLMVESMNAIATKGEKINSHGFAFLSKELIGPGLSPYYISLVNVAPFKSIERILHMDDFDDYQKLPDIIKKYINIYTEFSPDGHGGCIETLADTGIDILNNICTPRYEGYTSWSVIKSEMISKWEPKYFVSWGIFKELMMDELSQQYKNGNYSARSSSPEIGYKLIENAIDENYVYFELAHMTEYLDDNF